MSTTRSSNGLRLAVSLPRHELAAEVSKTALVVPVTIAEVERKLRPRLRAEAGIRQTTRVAPCFAVVHRPAGRMQRPRGRDVAAQRDHNDAPGYTRLDLALPCRGAGRRRGAAAASLAEAEERGGTGHDDDDAARTVPSSPTPGVSPCLLDQRLTCPTILAIVEGGRTGRRGDGQGGELG